MKKNYILFHVESLNSIVLQHYSELFPNIRKLINISTYYEKYYSTSTSTYMVVTDLFYGDAKQFEEAKKLEDIFCIKAGKKTLFDFLHSLGYVTKQFCYGNDYEEVSKLKNILCKHEKTWADDSLTCDSFIEAFETSILQLQPFAFFVLDVESHISRINIYPELENQEVSSQELFLYRYKRIDETIGLIFDCLKNKNLLGNTVIVLYGDHGDDLWGHGLHDGYMHAIEPYTDMIHCPLLVYNPDFKGGLVDRNLITTLDIYNLSLKCLNDEIYYPNNKVVYSRNLFAAQGICEDSFNKSYSATDGEYLLLVTKNGLKLFYNQIDIFNRRNILDFFEFYNNSLRPKEKYLGLQSGHFKAFMHSREHKRIKDSFFKLRQALEYYVKDLYKGGYGEMNFDQISYTNENSIGQAMLYKRIILGKLKKYIPVRIKNF